MLGARDLLSTEGFGKCKYVHSGQGLRLSSEGRNLLRILSGDVDSYVKFECNGKQYKTEVSRCTNNPSYGEEFLLCVPSCHMEPLPIFNFLSISIVMVDITSHYLVP